MTDVKPFHRAQALESVLQMATYAYEHGERLGIVVGRTTFAAHMAEVAEMMEEEMPDYRVWLEDQRQAERDQERHEVDHEPTCKACDEPEGHIGVQGYCERCWKVVFVYRTTDGGEQ
jgi:hypothetical protein